MKIYRMHSVNYAKRVEDLFRGLVGLGLTNNSLIWITARCRIPPRVGVNNCYGCWRRIPPMGVNNCWASARCLREVVNNCWATARCRSPPRVGVNTCWATARRRIPPRVGVSNCCGYC